MAKTRPPNPKIEALRQQGSLNAHPDRVKDPLFAAADFFDARDLVQVKYEMVRRVRVDGHPVSRSAAAFGCSRPTLGARLPVSQPIAFSPCHSAT